MAYHNQIKSQLLGVETQVIDMNGAVSAETAEQMVKGVCEKFKADIGIATTGIAGPSGGTNDKPVGTIYIAVKYLEKITVKHYVLRGGRMDFMIRAMNTAMKQLKEMI